jgi:alpha-mannosidase
MGEIISLQEMRERYRGQWVLVGYEELDDDLNVLRGEVLAHSPDKDEIYRQLMTMRGKKIAVEYLGEFPEDLVVVL